MSKVGVNSGGPAFPARMAPTEEVGFWECEGMTMRDYFAVHAPAQEIADMVGDFTVRSAAEYIGIPETEYKSIQHWPVVLAKARLIWADAMLAEREK